MLYNHRTLFVLENFLEKGQTVLLKISGESLTIPGHRGFKKGALTQITSEILPASHLYRVAVMVGGGNIGRGSEYQEELGLDENEEVDADWVGMLGTMGNGIMLKIFLKRLGLETRLITAKAFTDIGQVFARDKVIYHLEQGRVVILTGGTGNPRFTTDSAAVLRAREVGATLVLKGTKVDGIYDKDPNKHNDAKHIRHLTHNEFLTRAAEDYQSLKILDTTAVALARDNGLTIRVFKIFEPGSLMRVLAGEGSYSEISTSVATS